MPQGIEYLVKLAISLAVVYLFYRVALRRLTFYNWNRFYLLLYPALCFAIPFIDISPVVQRQSWSQGGLVEWIPLVEVKTAAPLQVTDPVTSFEPGYLLLLLLFAGMLLMLVRLLIQLVAFRRMMKKARLISDGAVKLYQVDAQVIPFSFGRRVFINPALHSEDELRDIIRHEFVHARQRHSLDIIWSELLCIVNWYNPFAWWIRSAIRQNLEFIADRQVLHHGIDRRQYQYLLLKVIGNRQFSIASPFNFSSLKTRIAMMNKMRSAGLHLLKFLFLLPILCVLLLAFRQRNDDRLPQALLPLTDTVAPAAINAKGFYLDVIGMDGDCYVRVKDQNGIEVEKIALNEWKARPKYAEKYGEILPPPNPVTAVSPLPPASPQTVTGTPPAPPSPPQSPFPAGDCQPATATAPVVASGLKNATRVRTFEITGKKATMKMKDGSTEVYDLTDRRQREKFEEKYGRIYETSATAPTVFASSGALGATAVTAPPGSALPVHSDRIITGSEDIIITITASTTREQLDVIIAQMREKGVELKFDNLDFNDGRLRAISGTMKKKGSTSNFSVTDLQTLTLAMTEKNGQVWFKISTREQQPVI